AKGLFKRASESSPPMDREGVVAAVKAVLAAKAKAEAEAKAQAAAASGDAKAKAEAADALAQADKAQKAAADAQSKAAEKAEGKAAAKAKPTGQSAKPVQPTTEANPLAGLSKADAKDTAAALAGVLANHPKPADVLRVLGSLLKWSDDMAE